MSRRFVLAFVLAALLSGALPFATAATQTKRIVWAASVAPGTHTIEIRVKGLKNAAATGTRVDIDAFLVQP